MRCGQAPAFTGITAWLNTPGDKPITLKSLRGKVVLVDFWTYSCINCQRSLPHVEAWYSRYHADGLDVIGVHSPEFAFEHVVSNVVSAAHQLGVHYPIAVDNNLATFNAYKNNYWPADYLIDASGQVRNIEDGEGNYGATEANIRTLLVAADPKVQLPPPTNVPDKTPVNQLTPESYLGYKYRFQNLANSSYLPDRPARRTSSRRTLPPRTIWPWPERGRRTWRIWWPARGPRSNCPSRPTTSIWSSAGPAPCRCR